MKHVGAGVERVDHHLPVDRAGDLDAAVGEVGRRRRHAPLTPPDIFGLRQEARQLAAVEAGLAFVACCQQLAALRAEPPLELCHERQRVGAQHPVVSRPHRPPDRDARDGCRLRRPFGMDRITHRLLPLPRFAPAPVRRNDIGPGRFRRTPRRCGARPPRISRLCERYIAVSADRRRIAIGPPGRAHFVARRRECSPIRRARQAATSIAAVV